MLAAEEWECIRDDGEPPAERAERRSTEETVRALCCRLKEPYRSVALGYFCRGMKLSEMAAATGQNLKTLQTQLYRSKKLLRAMWKEESA